MTPDLAGPGPVLKSSDYLRLAREVARLEAPRVGVHFLSSFSAEFLSPLIVVESYRQGLLIAPTFATFGVLEQELHDAGSELWARDTRAVAVLFRPEDVEPETYSARLPDTAERIQRFEDRLVEFADGVRVRSRSTIFVANAALPAELEAGTPSPLAYELQEFNVRLGRRLAALPDCHVLDWAGAVADYGRERWEDRRLWYLGRIPCGQDAAAFTAARLARRFASVMLPRTKCVVVDLDETLWGGAIGDDGLDGIELGGSYPGNVFSDFQRSLKALTRKGVLLAIASKNDHETVREAFLRHPEMVLTWDDFASHRVNWDDKAENLRAIAAELNIGLDSMVFLDDNPVECAAVERVVPELRVVCLGRDPLRFQSILSSIGTLDRPMITREDEDRVAMYAQQRQRIEHADRTESQAEFLASLRMEALVRISDANDLPRIVQLIGKTNQFNLTTRRYAHDEVRIMIEDPACRVATLRLSDIYGDLGIVGVSIITRGDDAREWRVDVFLMSCRAMSRGVEQALLAVVEGCAREAGADLLIGEYVPSAKNGIVRDLYPSHGYAAVGASDGPQRFTLDLRVGGTPWPDHIRRAG